ncbi:hypothetical protein DHEL01_v206251 [Diaporthe helianthi]|uniref:Uncharacterized protein n=1 Tax=Diaporthe helianthi TaxID=158607 RepID=A0A2P5HYM4_DIAHE|nr:hypothetical protein DHEL01_v206251 [Diaporthe helianthi]
MQCLRTVVNALRPAIVRHHHDIPYQPGPRRGPRRRSQPLGPAPCSALIWTPRVSFRGPETSTYVADHTEAQVLHADAELFGLTLQPPSRPSSTTVNIMCGEFGLIMIVQLANCRTHMSTSNSIPTTLYSSYCWGLWAEAIGLCWKNDEILSKLASASSSITATKFRDVCRRRPYPQKPRHNAAGLSTGAQAGIGVGISVVVLGAIAAGLTL